MRVQEIYAARFFWAMKTPHNKKAAAGKVPRCGVRSENSEAITAGEAAD
jgi:hypothetical protein